MITLGSGDLRFGWIEDPLRGVWHISWEPDKYMPCCCGLMIGGTPAVERRERIWSGFPVCGDCIYAVLTEENNALHK